jgi:hypothetical protein
MIIGIGKEESVFSFFRYVFMYEKPKELLQIKQTLRTAR